MQEKYNSNLTPTFRSTNSSFFITLKNLNYKHKKVAINDDFKQKSSDKWENSDKKVATNGDFSQKSSDKITKHKKKNTKELIIDFAKTNQEFTKKQIQEIINLKSARTRIILNELVNEGIIEIQEKIKIEVIV